MDSIQKITLKNMLPRVFEGQQNPPSQVWNTDLDLIKGKSYLIEAASGAGKSSLAAFIFGARTDFAGTLFFNSENTAGFSIAQWQEIRRRHLAYLPQELSLFPELTALENIMLKNRLTGYCSEQQILERLEQLGIADRAQYPAGRLSIGQMQRVAIIRALCQPFDFIILDEPVSHLDVANNRIASEMIRKQAESLGASVIVTSVGNPLEYSYNEILKL